MVTVHPTASIRHRRRLAWAAFAGFRSTARLDCMSKSMGLSLDFGRWGSPGAWLTSPTMALCFFYRRSTPFDSPIAGLQVCDPRAVGSLN